MRPSRPPGPAGVATATLTLIGGARAGAAAIGELGSPASALFTEQARDLL